MYAFTAPIFLAPTPIARSICRVRMCAPAGSGDVLRSEAATMYTTTTSSSSTNAPRVILDNTAVDIGSNGGGFIGDDPWHGHGGGDDHEGSDEELAALLQSRNAALSDVPTDLYVAYKRGLVGIEAIRNYFHAHSNVISRLLMNCGAGMRTRFLADKLFLLKIAIEEGIGIVGKLSAEYESRKDKFWVEKEFVFANLVSALLADFALVYLPAPSVRLTPAPAVAGWRAQLSAFASNLPTGVFQTDRAFTATQRAAAFGLKATQLFAVGFACSLTSILITNSAIWAKEKLDPAYKSETAKQNALLVPLLYGTFLGASSNTRYQIVNGIEGLVFPKVFRGAPQLIEQSATFGLRYANTFAGSLQWVWFCRVTGAQKLKEKKE